MKGVKEGWVDGGVGDGWRWMGDGEGWRGGGGGGVGGGGGCILLPPPGPGLPLLCSPAPFFFLFAHNPHSFLTFRSCPWAGHLN